MKHKRKSDNPYGMLRDRLIMQLFLGAIVGVLGSLSAPVQAQTNIDEFDNRAVQFAEDTVVEFEFDKSLGVYQSSFGIVNLSQCSGSTVDTCQKTELFREVRPFDKGEALTLEDKRRASLGQTRDPNDFIGTAGTAILGETKKKFTFQANTRYAFYLDSVYVHDVAIKEGNSTRVERRTDRKPTVYSVNTESTRLSEGFTGLSRGGVRIQWDDTGIARVSQPGQINPDSDFNDFAVVAGGSLVDVTVPCVPIR
ncbi:MAG: hypothetical protein WA828_15205 [Coleofasciculaceae cyanobacterium]